MSASEIMLGGGICVAAVLTLIQISPLKIDPWSVIAKALGRSLCAEVLERMDESQATSARYRIIRFDDEIRNRERHTEEHFNQIIDDIDTYEQYCNTHLEYKNNKAVCAIANIKRVYKKCHDENSFM